MNLKEFLQDKPIFYKKFNPKLMPQIYAQIRTHLPQKEIIHIIGTNGKGSTGRFLAQILHLCGKSVGHYTSPHIFSFNERFYINDRIANDDELENSHQILQKILGANLSQKLSYFEYATLLAMIVFEKCEFVIMEAGMGAQFDATNVFAKKLSLFTPIGLDHLGILGNNIEEISYTKLIAMCKNAILNDEMNEISTKIAVEISTKKQTNLFFAKDLLDKSDYLDIKVYCQKFQYPNFQQTNLALACAGSKFLGAKFDLKMLKALDLQGRFMRVGKNVIVDVGHNELAAKEVVRNLNKKQVVLIYNSFFDKDIRAILAVFKDCVKRVEILDYKSVRPLGGEKITKILDEFGIKHSKFTSIYENENYVVFGSFMLVEAFLKENFDNR